VEGQPENIIPLPTLSGNEDEGINHVFSQLSVSHSYLLSPLTTNYLQYLYLQFSNL